MAGKTFTRNRIRGISFHHARGAAFTRQRNDRRAPPAWSGPKADDLRNSKPAPLSKSDINRLLLDHSRAEMHELVSQSIDHLIQLQQLAHSLKKLIPATEVNRHDIELDETDQQEAHPMQLTALEVVSLQRVWKLRLELLEMIVMAQNSLRNFQPEAAKTTPQRAARFDRSRK